MSDSDVTDRQKSSPAIVVFVLAGLPLLLFAPLLLSFAEHSTTGTNHVEQFCRTIGVHGFLGTIYEPVIELIQRFR